MAASSRKKYHKDQPMPTRHSAARSISSDSAGFTLVYVIIGMVVLTTLSVGVYTITSRSGTDMAKRVPHDQVILLAQSGLNYAAAMAKVVEDDETIENEDKAGQFKTMLEAESYPIILGAGEFRLDAGEVITGVDLEKIIVTSAAELGDVSFSLSTDFEYSFSLLPSGANASIFALNSPNSNQSLDNQNTVDGSIHGINITLGNQSEVTGDVIATGNVTLINHAEVGGGICAAGNVDLQNHTSVAEDIHSFGNVILGANKSEVAGNIYASGNVELLNGAQVQGDIHAGGNVTLGSNNSRVHGSIYATGNVTMQHQTIVDNNVHAGGNVELTTRGTVQGNVNAGGSLVLVDQSVITTATLFRLDKRPNFS
jgi:cytoskeletal protein CcmA (bactofilin family)